ncbi:prephenate dehydrogenase/arogenate dehydrogenase family protein [Pelistega indica]|uniref:prephenate dehydrogenase/arogenate dehydrogenase family protein n=1 Tax=Pelistega indica TaxID=1414851 RepID=UPI000425F524|nr:prephenate dehydrogenase/arogenate dehydrogenase family protein [Pelistega indica]
MKKIKTLGIIGVGLIGGSFALALKRQGLVEKVLGAGKDDNSLGLAKALGIIDEVVTIAEMATLADVIVIAAPVNAFVGNR